MKENILNAILLVSLYIAWKIGDDIIFLFLGGIWFVVLIIDFSAPYMKNIKRTKEKLVELFEEFWGLPMGLGIGFIIWAFLLPMYSNNYIGGLCFLTIGSLIVLGIIIYFLLKN